jgi:type II secretory pathway component GspD/PulD (secretin)
MNKEVASIRKELKALTAAPATQLKRYMLKHAQADEVAKLLQQVFGKTPTLRLATDGRTNSLLVHGLAEDQQTIEAIITRLDVDASVKPNK